MKKKLFSLMLSTVLCSTYSAVAMMEEVEFTSTGVAQVFQRHPDKLEIVTDNNTAASYQGKSKGYAVKPGQIVKVDYSIEVTQGIMSLGALNTHANGWYANEKGDVWEIIRKVGTYNETIEWLVPANELETSLVLRNYHLAESGESCFKVNKMSIAIKDALDPAVQAYVSKMHPLLLAIYQKPADQRKACIAEVCTDPDENDKSEIYDCIQKIKEESGLKHFSIKINTESLNSNKKSNINLRDSQYNNLQNAVGLKNKAEQSMKDLLIQAENSACLWAAPHSSAEQLELVKKVFIKYLADNHNLKKIDIKTQMSQSASQQQVQRDQQSSLFNSLLENLGSIFNVDKWSFLSNNNFKGIDQFELKYYQEKATEKHALWQYNFAQDNINQYNNEIILFENKIKALETPLYLFLDDLESIGNLL